MKFYRSPVKCSKIEAMAFTLDYTHSGISDAEILSAAQALKPYLQKLRALNPAESLPESFMRLPEDPAVASALSGLHTYDRVILIGIGGSSLGAASVAHALGVGDRLLVLDDIDDDRFTRTKELIESAHQDGRSCGYVVVSKSGTTIETLANFELLLPFLKTLDPAWSSNMTVVTDAGSALEKVAQERHFAVLASSAHISGRFSLFDTVGLAPLAMLGVSTDQLRAGASSMAVACLQEDDLKNNPAAWGAALMHLQAQKAKNIQVLFPFSSRMESFAYWWRQLLAESLSKSGQGITPIISGPADLHSMAQRYMDGPKDFTALLMHMDGASQELMAGDVNPELKGMSVGALEDAIFQSVCTTFGGDIPFGVLKIEENDAQTMGALSMLVLMQTAYTAQLMGINAFDQPGVEGYKKEVQAILHKK